jgi:tRNA-dihydrouridine synthase
VRTQLLGSDLSRPAADAPYVCRPHAGCIDLNFGYIAALMNRNRGGPAVLDKPDLPRRIAAAVCAAVPAGTSPAW